MLTGKYEFAGKVVEVNSLHGKVHEYCAEYLTDAPADFSVTTTQEDIDYERARSEHKGSADGYLEELAVYRKISEKMPSYDTILWRRSIRNHSRRMICLFSYLLPILILLTSQSQLKEEKSKW